MYVTQASLSDLAGIARRVAISSKAGVDIRTTWKREAERAPFRLRGPVLEIAQAVNNGDSLETAIRHTGQTFPEDFREMVAVAEQTGALPEVLFALADHYEKMLQFRREFLRQITWPMIQLCMSLCTIGLFIYVLGILSPDQDPLGIGLTGTKGLAVYIMSLVSIAAVGYFLYKLAVSGAAWVKPMQYFILSLPFIGSSLRTLALSQFATILSVTLAAGVDIRRAVALALRSTHLVPFTDTRETLHDTITQGNELHEGMRKCPIFPNEFIDAVAVGEETGNLPESMHSLARNYRDLAYAAIGTLTQIAAILVWAAIAALIVYCIFKIYTGMILQPLQEQLNAM